MSISVATNTSTSCSLPMDTFPLSHLTDNPLPDQSSILRTLCSSAITQGMIGTFDPLSFILFHPILLLFYVFYI